MMGMDRYLDAYVDRRMQSVVTEWDLATTQDIGDLNKRLEGVEKSIASAQEIDKAEAEKLGALEARVHKLQGR